jgi:hypothetical protein
MNAPDQRCLPFFGLVLIYCFHDISCTSRFLRSFLAKKRRRVPVAVVLRRAWQFLSYAFNWRSSPNPAAPR